MIILKKQHKRYSKTSQTDIGYLKSYPANWDLERLRFSISLNPVKSNAGLSDDTEVSFVPMEKVSEDGKIDAEETRLVEDVKDGYTYFAENDVLMAKITPCFENGKGCVAKKLVNDVGFGSTEFTVLRPNKDIDSRFLYYLTYSDEVRKNGEQEMRGSAGQKRVPDLFIKDYWYARPSIEEQKTISRYLDKKIRLIESIVNQKQEQIELLKRKKTALINKVVSKGLDNKAKMKDSGIEWVGETPMSWRVERLKFLTPLSSKKTSTPSSSDIYIALENVESWTGKLINVDENKEFESVVNVFKKGDVLFGKLRPYLAKVVLADFNGLCTGEMLVLRPDTKKVTQKFAYFRMISSDFINEVNFSTYGAKMPRANWTFIGNMRIPFPSIEEQIKIVEFLENKTNKIDNCILKIQESIGILKEYKTSLISNIVTGRINIT